MHPKTVGLIAHTGKPGVGELIKSLTAEFARFSISILLEKETAAVAGQRSDTTIAQLAGKADLLEGIKETGSISEAAAELGMSYMRAWTLIRTMNTAFREPLVLTVRGGEARLRRFLHPSGVGRDSAPRGPRVAR